MLVLYLAKYIKFYLDVKHMKLHILIQPVEEMQDRFPSSFKWLIKKDRKQLLLRP